ncbi:DUF805 domain-containing protein [Staphylococcus canis]|uniref:DUF805 domain-containing protein n=1 Tax=Staphylococcus canis TaxID=2724942 RepID=A0ABS0T6U4_9STAP|nr:DUF805 domain-containing protein [Staphylococcus canis]MBI5974285.1 DUF805 domain-containing protein [Staphylococcus canis]
MNEMPQVGFLEAYKLFWKNYVNFKGRSRRSEYWWVALWHTIVVLGGGLLSIVLFFIPFIGIFIGGIGFLIVFVLYPLAIVIPNYALLTRRFHDRGMSMLIPIVSLILSVTLSISNVVQESRTIFEDTNTNYTVQENLGILSGLPDWLIVIIGLLSLILTVVSFIVALLDSQKHTNKYGPSPKYSDHSMYGEGERYSHHSQDELHANSGSSQDIKQQDPYKY